MRRGKRIPKSETCLFCGTPLFRGQKRYCRPEHRAPYLKRLRKKRSLENRGGWELCESPGCFEIFLPNKRGVKSLRCASCKKARHKEMVKAAKARAKTRRPPPLKPPKQGKRKAPPPFARRRYAVRHPLLHAIRPIELEARHALAERLGFNIKTLDRALRLGGHCLLLRETCGKNAVRVVPLEAARFAEESLLQQTLSRRHAPLTFLPQKPEPPQRKKGRKQLANRSSPRPPSPEGQRSPGPVETAPRPPRRAPSKPLG